MTATHQNRELRTGRYTYDGNLERLCVCGHSLGVHCATRLKIDGKMVQDCFFGGNRLGEGDDDVPCCDCQCFKPARRTKADLL